MIICCHCRNAAGIEHGNNENSLAASGGGDATARSATTPTSGDDVFKVPAPPPSKGGKSKQKKRHLTASPELAKNHEDDLYEQAMYLKNWVPRLRKRKRYLNDILLQFGMGYSRLYLYAHFNWVD